MRVAVMQPYFVPYIGYFQLIAAVDCFIVYDNIQYTKKGWINRNKILKNSKETVFTLPLKNDTDTLDIRERELAETFNPKKLLAQISDAYRRAPYFNQTMPLVQDILQQDTRNLFQFLHYSILKTCAHIGLKTKIRISSNIAIDHTLRSQEKVIALCQAVGGDTYINSIGGQLLYAKDDFLEKKLKLHFIQPRSFIYDQLGSEFTPWLSIIDVMMFNSPETTRTAIYNNYDLV